MSMQMPGVTAHVKHDMKNTGLTLLFPLKQTTSAEGTNVRDAKANYIVGCGSKASDGKAMAGYERGARHYRVED